MSDPAAYLVAAEALAMSAKIMVTCMGVLVSVLGVIVSVDLAYRDNVPVGVYLLCLVASMVTGAAVIYLWLP